jgi:8-oxo-dGTP pyrophosphatase MutT (NUDIX family)
MKIFFDANGKKVPLPKDEEVLWRISGYALIQDHGRILVVVPTWNDQFELPGGGVEEQENIKDGIIRECYEETGYKINIPDIAPSYVGEENFYHRHLRKFYHSLIVVYRARLRSCKQNLKVVNTYDGNEIKKISWEDLPTFTRRNTHRIVYPVIQNLKLLRK